MRQRPAVEGGGHARQALEVIAAGERSGRGPRTDGVDSYDVCKLSWHHGVRDAASFRAHAGIR